MIYWLIALLIGINLCIFPMGNVAILEAQGIFAFFMIMAGFFLSFSFERNVLQIKNYPLTALNIWVVLTGSYFLYVKFLYPDYGLFNAVCLGAYISIMVLYSVITNYLTSDDIYRAMDVLRWVVVVTVILSVAQLLGLSQVFRVFEARGVINNPVVGFVGNGAHNSNLLVMLSPLFINFQRRKSRLIDASVLISIFLLIFVSGTTVGDISLISFVIFFFGLIYMNKEFFWKIKYWLIAPLLALVAFGVYFLFTHPLFITEHIRPQARLGVWEYYLKVYKTGMIEGIVAGPMTGMGMGFVSLFAKNTPFPTALHLHNEFFQAILQFGWIVIFPLVWLLSQFFAEETETMDQRRLKCIVIGFLIASMLNPSAHVWLIAVYVMTCYAGFKVLRESEYE